VSGVQTLPCIPFGLSFWRQRRIEELALADKVFPVSHLLSRDQSARKRCWAVRNDPICCRRQASNRHGRWWVEPFFIAGAIFACADKHGTA